MTHPEMAALKAIADDIHYIRDLSIHNAQQLDHVLKESLPRIEDGLKSLKEKLDSHIEVSAQ